MTTKSIGFDIFAKDRASDKFDKVGRASSSAGDKLKTFAKAGALAAGAALVGLGAAAFSAAKAAMADEKAQALLAKQLKNSAGATKAQVAATEDWITKQGIALGVTDDDLRPALAKLTAVTHDVGKAQKLSSLAMNVSAGTGKNLSTVSAALAKAQLGQVSGLSKLGVQTKNADGSTRSLKDITEDLAKTYKGSATTAANTAEGKFGRLKLIFDETKESIGSKLLPILTNMATWFLTKGLPALQKFGGEIKEKFGPIIERLVGWFKEDLLPALQDLWAKAMPALQKAFDSVKKALSNAQPFFDLLGKVFVNVILPVLGKVASVALPLLGKALEVVGKGLGLAAGFVTKLASAFLLMAEYGIKGFRFLLTAAFATFGGILDAAATGLGWIPGIGDKIKGARDAFKDFGDKTINKLKGVEDALHRTRDAINGIPRNINIVVKYTTKTAPVGGGSTRGFDLDPTGRSTAGGWSTDASGRRTGGPLAGLVASVEAGKTSLQKAFDIVAGVIEKAKSKLADLISRRSDLAGSFGSFTSSAFSADLSNPETGAAPTAGSLVAFQRAELAKAQRLKQDVRKLIKMGLSKDLIQQLAASGESGIAQIHALAAGSKTDVASLNSLNAQTQAALDAAGMSAGNAVFGAQIDQAKGALATAVEVRKQLQAWRQEEQNRSDRETVLQVNLTGRTLRMSLLELKRQNGGAALGLA